MKTGLSILILLLLGTGLGIMLAMMEFSPVPPLFDETESGQNDPTAVKPVAMPSADPAVIEPDATSKNSPPKIKIDREVYDFGMAKDSKLGHHEFLIENVGGLPLTLEVKSTTCKCTKGEVVKNRLFSGEKTKLILEWDPKGYAGEFEQTATVGTNDPARPTIEFKVKGRVHAPMAIVPRTIVFGQVTNLQDLDGAARLYLFEQENATIDKIEFQDKETASFYTARFEKLPARELDVQPGAKAGYQIHVDLASGMNQGPITQTAIITTSSKELGKIDLPIEGKIVGNISIYGPGWDDERNLFRLGVVDGQAGIKKTLTVVVRHMDGQPIPIRVGSITPSGILKATLSDSKTGATGKASYYKLTIEIPPGTPAANHLGTSQSPSGHILLTTRPDGPTFDLRVGFVVEN